MNTCLRAVTLVGLIGTGVLGLSGCANSGPDPNALPPPPTGQDVVSTSGPNPMPVGRAVPVAYDSSAQLAAPAPMGSLAGQASIAQPTSSAGSVPPQSADPWPRDVTLSNADALIYQPQIESWTGNQMKWRVAVALRPTGVEG